MSLGLPSVSMLPLSHPLPGPGTSTQGPLVPRELSPSRSASSSSEPSLADVESASLADTEAQSSSVDPLEDGEAAAAAAEQVKAERWLCDLCFEPNPCFETPWSLQDERCNHSFCRRCLLGSIRWGGRCPYDHTPIPPIVVCGAMGTGEYVYHEKLNEARRTGGVPCSVSDCPGIASSVDGRQPRASGCRTCGTRHCGRRVCGVPWSEGHRCWDLLEEETLRRGRDFQAATSRRLASAPRFRPCPQCSAMVEHGGGCNMVYHESCRTRWCFICRRVGTCQDYDCKAPTSGPPTPRGPPPATTSSSVSGATSASNRKAVSPLTFIMALVSLVVLLAFDTCLGLRLAVHRKGLPLFLSKLAEVPDTCGQTACASQALLLSERRPSPPEVVEV